MATYPYIDLCDMGPYKYISSKSREVLSGQVDGVGILYHSSGHDRKNFVRNYICNLTILKFIDLPMLLSISCDGFTSKVGT